MAPRIQNMVCFAALLLLGSSCSGFTPTSRQQQLQTPRTKTSLSETKTSKEDWTFNPFDVNDLSPLDTLLRRGVVPLGIRLGRPEKYEEAVLDYMRKERCDRATAQRNMDAFFNDPNGWVVSYGRKRDLGEDFGDINAPTGVQKRPVFSLLWGSFCVWLFFVFFPTRIEELGGVQPTFTQPGGACLYQKRDDKGALYCENGPKGFEKSAMDYLDKQKE
mmetsp:Transcript_15009/g.31128  ORF Transcript_15009/g.31128 Transcript_15009/m.31128 type:complete len:218 (+) Transcript_15009:61-714(+)